MRVRFLFVLLLLCLGPGVVGCPSRESVGMKSVSILGAGVINDPRNKSLRFDILKFGLERFCFEMTRRGAPLKLTDDQPVLGRFFADQCTSQVIDDELRKSFVVQYAGKGYGWQAITGRVGFTSSGLIEYAPDFQVHEGAMYIYFRPRQVDSTTFQLSMVESRVAQTGAAMLGIKPEDFGQQIVKGQLGRGFTVIRWSASGETEFGMGYIALGQRPFHPFQIQNSEKVTLANDRTEVHSNQQDFVGAFEVTDDDQALYLDATIDGAQAVDVFVMPKGVGDLMIDAFMHTPGPVAFPPTAQPLFDDPLALGQPWKRYLRLPKGLYYLMFDNTANVGRVSPARQVGDDRAAKLDYLVQLGETP